MCWRHGAIRQNRKSLIILYKFKSIQIILQKNVIGDILSDIIVFSKTRFFVFFENGRREPVRGRRELVSHHGATGGGVRGPKMRHLVLYKLAGFFPTDWQPCSGGLCPQKRGHFCAKLCTN